MANATLQRKNMVEGQVRTSDVTDRRIPAAMMAIPREAFLHGSLAALAYSDENLTIAPGQVMLAPRILAKLVQLAAIEDGDTALVIGTGYAAAVVARLAETVIALLPDSKAAAAASEALAGLGITNVSAIATAPASGYAARAPYDVILIEGGVESVPEVIQEQLRNGGRLVAIGVERAIGQAFLIHKIGGVAARRPDFQAGAPLLPGFEVVRPAFVF
jgi:protein-L-isoaspartate(D-aspartate) O-methyltransferase